MAANQAEITKYQVDKNLPCNNCPHFEHCAQGYACRAFSSWLRQGSKQKRRHKPNRKIYEDIYNAR